MFPPGLSLGAARQTRCAPRYESVVLLLWPRAGCALEFQPCDLLHVHELAGVVERAREFDAIAEIIHGRGVPFYLEDRLGLLADEDRRRPFLDAALRAIGIGGGKCARCGP